MLKILLAVHMFISSAQALQVRGFTLNETQLYPYDAASMAPNETAAQKAVDRIYGLGARHIILTAYARMSQADSNTVVPLTPPGATRAQERERYLRLIRYIHSKGITVGLRPLLNVADNVNANQWRGNIRPSDPLAWFSSYRSYLDIYANIARIAGAEEFTLGAELYSMTVGIEDQWPEQAYGFPREWWQLACDMRAKLGSQVRLMYDIHFADAYAQGDSTESGGELERWRYRLVDLKPDPARPFTMDPSSRSSWEQLRDLWLSFDVIGIDAYRSLLARSEDIPSDNDMLARKLEMRATHYASDIDAKLRAIEGAVGARARVIIKQVGYRSCAGCFIDPFLQDNRREWNESHQAAAYQTFFNAFVKARWSWLEGVDFWEVSTDPASQGSQDVGFSPLGKPLTERVIEQGWDL